jgi:tetratricopeptide (TPR) repeat protein
MRRDASPGPRSKAQILQDKASRLLELQVPPSEREASYAVKGGGPHDGRAVDSSHPIHGTPSDEAMTAVRPALLAPQEHSQVERCLREAVSLLEQDPDAALCATAKSALSAALVRKGDYRAALALEQEALEVRKELDLREEMDSAVAMGLIHELLGDNDQAEDLFRCDAVGERA